MEIEPKIISSFSLQDELNPKIWDNNQTPENAKLKEDIRKKLLQIAYEFMEFIELDFFVDDIIFTGSLSNFNWSDFSDVDLHLEVDFDQFSEKTVDLYRELFNLKKLLFNTNHDITIKGFEVELYVQDIVEPHTSGGIYSVLFDKWIDIPQKKKLDINKNFLKKKITNWTSKIDSVVDQSNDLDYDETIAIIKDIRDKIKKYRKLGLDNKGELSYENLVFKYLRRSGYIEKLQELSNKVKDKKLSIEGSINESILNKSLFVILMALFSLNNSSGSKSKEFVKNIETLIQSKKVLSKGKTTSPDKDVETLQKSLQLLGYELPNSGSDGKFGPETYNAVIKFQKDNQLAVDGIVGKETLKKLLGKLANTNIKEDDIARIEKQKPTTPVSANKNLEKIMSFLTSKGLSKEQAAGIAGNIQAESNFNPNIFGDNSTSFGIAQWHNDRKHKLINWTKEKGVNHSTIEGQLHFLWHELSTDYKHVLNSIKQVTTPKESAEIFASQFEKPKSQDYSKRVKYAENIFNSNIIS